MDGTLEEFESPELEPLTPSVVKIPKPDHSVKLILKKSGPLVDETDAYEIIRKRGQSLCLDNHLVNDSLEIKRKTPIKNRELKRLQQSFVDSMDLSDPFTNLEPRNRRQSKYFEIELKKTVKRSKSFNRSKSSSSVSSSKREWRKSRERKSMENHEDDQWASPPKKGKDSYCWKCKKFRDLVACYKCERSFHLSCIKYNPKADPNCLCPECFALENFHKANLKAGKIPFLPEELNKLLSLAINRVQNQDQFKLFKDDSYLQNVNKKYIVKPITIGKLNEKASKNIYKTTEEFASEVKWFLHNVLIVNNILGQNNKLLASAKMLVTTMKNESIEIECCSECYFAGKTKENWFIDVCSKPHLIVWAKLKGFPFWPAKVMGLKIQHMVSVRFFGDHDRAQIPVKDCFLYSKEYPCPGMKKNNRSNLQNCINEVETHIGKLKQKYGIFEYAPQKTPYDPNREIEQLNQMLPKYKEIMEKQSTKGNTGLQFKIYKTSDNNLSMTKIQNSDNQKSPEKPSDVQKKSNYSSVTTRVVLKRRPSGEYVVENKRKKRLSTVHQQRNEANPLVAEIMRKNQGVTITKIPSVIENGTSSTTTHHNPFVIKSEPVDYDETPVEPSETINNEPQNTESLNENINNISIVKLERDPPRRREAMQQSTPIVPPPEPTSSFEMSSNMVCIPLATTTPPSNPVDSTQPQSSTETSTERSFSPSAGPFTRRLEDNTHKLTKFFRSILLETYHDMAKDNDSHSLDMTLRLEMEKEKKEFYRVISQKNLEIKELNHIISQKTLEIKELVQSFEKTKADIRRECELDKRLTVEATKRKQWCSNCWKEAQLYCCWNTSYCSYDCQTKHWTVHGPTCNNHDRPESTMPMNKYIPKNGRNRELTTLISDISNIRKSISNNNV